MSDTDLDLGQTLRGFAPGENLFGRYTLKTILGRGGMGVVWRAFDEHLERDVALKFLPELIVLDHAALDELKRETKRNLELTHHNIVRIYDFAHEDQTACISMEYVDGATLSALRVQREAKVFNVTELRGWAAQFCDALQYAHAKARIVHRDLKPANLMVNAAAQLKITDFGIARSLSDSVSMLSMRGTSGTLLYMSPQQLDGERPSSLDDIYALGATLYELLTSKPPFFSGAIETQIREKMPATVAARRKELGIENQEAVPDDWERTIADCLAKEPAARPPSAAELAFRLGLAPRQLESTPVMDKSATAMAELSPNATLVSASPPIVLTPVPREAAPPFPWRRVAAIGLAALALIGFGSLVIMGLKSMWNVADDVSNREPTSEWARTVPLEKMAAAFGKGSLLSFEPKEVAIVREGPGLVHVTANGIATTRGALYQPVSNENGAVISDSKMAEWRKAQERADFLRQRAGTNVPAVDENLFQFVRETTPAGKAVEFRCQFKARRVGSDWEVDRIISADLVPPDALQGQSIAEFSSPAILGTDKANRERRMFAEAIDKYIAAVAAASAQAIKRFAKAGQDADGNPLFPVDTAMPGERFAQTRSRTLQPLDVQNWSDDDVQYAINEALARHGFVFEDKRVLALFSNLGWYHPRRNLSAQQIEESLSDLELQNIRTLVSVIGVRRETAERARQAAENERRAAESARQAAIAQQRQMEAVRAQQEAARAQEEAAAQAQREAALQAQRDQAAAAIVGGILDAILNHRK
jgi:serine/threonine protein kinase